MVTLKLSLCEKGCIYADITLKKEWKCDRWRNRYSTGRKELVIFCGKQLNYIQKLKEECSDYSNAQLTEGGIEKFW